MIQFDKFELDNGLRVIVHTDNSTPRVAVNLLYDVGARDEDPELTGFAHLFEHLMFEGSENIPVFDAPLELAGGQNNAFTSNDITNYYNTLPVENIETAFWLESDRMQNLAFSEESLNVQRSVVIEEFKQRYLNQPYGDVWLKLRPLAYTKHPYQWPTIGKSIEHIENANLDQVKAFFKKHYNPCNAILVVSGNVKTDRVKALSEKWFGPIEKGNKYERNLPIEPTQTEYREATTVSKVPSDALYLNWHMAARNTREYYVTDLISDLLSRGNSSRLNTILLKEKQLFSSVDAYVGGSNDPGLFSISGKLMPGKTMDEAVDAINECLLDLCTNVVSETELNKVKNNIESTHLFNEMSILNKAMNLAYFELLGDANMVNKEVEKYISVSAEEIKAVATSLFKKENCTRLNYMAIK